MTQETFERELARRADQVYGAPLTFETVTGRARQIRRRRRTGAAAAVAAAVAAVVLVPTALIGNGGDRAPEPAPAPAGASVLHDGVVTLPDGAKVPLDVDDADVSQLAVLTDGRIVLAHTDPAAVQVYSPKGDLTATYPGGDTITTSADDDVVAWVGEDYYVRTLASGQAEPTKLPGIPMAGEAVGSIDAVLDGKHLLVGDFTTTTNDLTPDGATDLAAATPFRVTDVSPDGGLWAVDLPPGPDEQFGCAALWRRAEARIVARTCETSRLRFAPDGRHLVGMRSENNMASEVTVLGLDLRSVRVFRPDDGVVSRAGWDGNGHLLVSTVRPDDQQWSLLRVPLDGKPQTVAGPDAGGNPESVAEYQITG